MNEILKQVRELKKGDQVIARDGALLTVEDVFNPGRNRNVIITFERFGCLPKSNLDCRGTKMVRVLA